MNDVQTSERDFGMAWSVACIMLAIGIGCGVVQFIDQQALVDYKIECVLQDLEQKFTSPKHTKTRPVATVEDSLPPTGIIQSMVLQ